MRFRRVSELPNRSFAGVGAGPRNAKMGDERKDPGVSQKPLGGLRQETYYTRCTEDTEGTRDK